MSYYFIARISVHDPEGYERYLAGTGPLLERYQATVLAVDEAPAVLEGEWPATRTVLLRFPDEESAKAWYGCPEYQALAQRRHASSSGDAVLIAGRE
ncbi:MAG: DUF1330 domain-containing protein [Actinomycetota bacterium]|nr:DUF1330 domain-containing protein [Actinomycetota bacterium]